MLKVALLTVTLVLAVSPALTQSLFLDIRCSTPDAHLNDTTVFHPTVAQRKILAASYSDPAVVGLDRATIAYLLRVADPETQKSLAQMTPSILSDRFTILSIEPNLMGGRSLKLLFNHHRDAVYWAWMYHLGGGPWVVRSLQKTVCSRLQLEWILHRYSEVLPPQ